MQVTRVWNRAAVKYRQLASRSSYDGLGIFAEQVRRIGMSTKEHYEREERCDPGVQASDVAGPLGVFAEANRFVPRE